MTLYDALYSIYIYTLNLNLDTYVVTGNKQWSALPASLRWTAPEVLLQPTAVESSSSNIFQPAVDIYSYG